jgi:Flp pilus assembly protein TadB
MARHEPTHCPYCGGTGRRSFPGDDPPFAPCPNCGATVQIGESTIHVSGRDSREVHEVFKAAADQEAARQAAEVDRTRRAQRQLAGPWRSGLFYLVAALVMVGVVAIVAAVLPVWTLPLIVTGAVVLLLIVSALQLRQDEKLGEQNFLQLIALALRQLRLFERNPVPPQ